MHTEHATARELIEYGAELFERAGIGFYHGTDNALDESAALVLYALGIDYDQPDAVLDEVLPAEARERAAALLLERVTTRKPAAYLTGRTWFAGLPFSVDERVLIPRSPIAELVLDRFEPWIASRDVHNVLDLCTGSGCIGIACAHAFPDAHVTITDISEDALEVARVNVQLHDKPGQVTVCQANLFDGLTPVQYDIIVANPPYIPDEEYAGLDEEFSHEPAVGLVAGVDGLDLVRHILAQAAGWLQPHGILVVEVGYTHELLVEAYPMLPFTWLEFEHGGEGVFLLNCGQLQQYRDVLGAAAR